MIPLKVLMLEIFIAFIELLLTAHLMPLVWGIGLTHSIMAAIL